MTSKLKKTRAAHRRAVYNLLKRGISTEDSQTQNVDELRSVLELIKEKYRKLSKLNSQIMEIIAEEDIDGEIEEVDRYELDILIGIKKTENYIKEVSQSYNQSVLNPNVQEEFMCPYTSIHIQEHSIPSHQI